MATSPSTVSPIVIARLQDLRRRTLRSVFLRNTLALISGTVVTQAIVFLASPILSRVFGLEDFGDLANYNAWVAMLALLGNLRYEHAIFVARGWKNISRVIALTVLLSVSTFVLYLAGALCIRFLYHGGGYLANLQRIILYVPIGTLAVSVSSVFIQFNVKSGQFKLLATVTAAQAILTLIPQIVLGRLGVPNALIVGTILGFVFSGITFGWLFAAEGRLHAVRNGFRPVRLVATARAHLNFPRYTMAADAVTVIAQQFVPVFVLALFNPAVAGLYAFSLRVVRVPMVVISTAVAGVLRKEAADQVHAGRSLARLFGVTVRSLALISLLPFVGVLLFAKPVFALVFGHRWAGAGQVVQILSPGILMEFIALPLATFFLVTNTQRYTLLIQVAGFVLLVGALFAGKHFFSDFAGTCYLVSGVMLLVNLLSIVLAGRVAGFWGSQRGVSRA